MNPEVEPYIRRNVQWSKLPENVQQQLGNSSKDYDKCIVNFSVRNQVRFKGNLVRQVKRDEKRYYNDLVDYSQKNLMLFPYHLSDDIIKSLVITPFTYYVSMLDTIMALEKSYDSLPNFTAADCLRLLGIGRNQYIDLMNSSRSSKKFGFFRKSGKELLPQKPCADKLMVQPWWVVRIGYVTEEDVKFGIDKAEHCLIDQIIDTGPCPAGHLNYNHVISLYEKGLIYFDVPIGPEDSVIVPPLEGFVMNRVLGDFFENLLYKIFVSIDEHTTVKELADILEIELHHVQNAVSLYCRLGFAKKKNADLDSNDLHPSWYEHLEANDLCSKKKGNMSTASEDEDDSLLKELNRELCDEGTEKEETTDVDEDTFVKPDDEADGVREKKIAFLFDSTLTAFLMMGNLSPGLKRHAVTMFEVGKLSDEMLDSLVEELEKVSQVEGEGEAARYFSHAIALKQTISFFRHNQVLGDMCAGLDLIRCESLQSLDPSTASRLLNKNYTMLVSMAPLANEPRPIHKFPPHLGPPIPEISSVWFKMFLYHMTKTGPPSLLLPKGYKPRKLPKIFQRCQRLLVTTWGHDPTEIPAAGALNMLLDALLHSPILVQAFSNRSSGKGISDSEVNNPNLVTVPFPIDSAGTFTNDIGPCLNHLKEVVDIEHSCGFVTAVNLDIDLELDGVSKSKMDPENADILREEVDSIDDKKKGMTLKLSPERPKNWVLLDVNFGIPLFDAQLNKDICDRIVSNGLWKSESLENLQSSSKDLCRKLLDFISEFRGLPLSASKNPSRFSSTQISDCGLPTKPLYFDGANIQTL